MGETPIKKEIEAAELKRQQVYMQRVRELVAQRYPTPPLAHVHSYGCQQNVADGEKIKGMLACMGYGFTNSVDEADCIIYNTCAVRKGAEDRVFGNAGALKHQKQRRPGMVIGLCGCMMQQQEVAQRIRKSYPHVDLVFGTHALHKLPEHLYQVLTEKKRVFDLNEEESPVAEGLPIRRDGSLKAWLPIMYGCDNFCTYCIVPYVRGREQSRRPQQILEEARSLVEQGYKEITLLGQNVNSYGKGLEEPIDFAELLRRINEIPGEFWVRFMTSHPKDCTHELIDTIGACEKICNHIHLPVQSGSDRVLRAMNRHYTKEQYLELVDYARKQIPGVTFTSDIIVGFPGETYEEFQQTLELIRKVGYDALFTFIYSKRPGTPAAKMEDPVPEQEKSRWFRELLDVQNQIGLSRYQALVGSTLRVLAEGPGKSGEGYLTGRDAHNTIVEFRAPASCIGRFVDVKITTAFQWAVGGELADS